MRGIPFTLKTKADYELVRAEFPAEDWVPRWQALLDTVSVWVQTGEVTDGGVTDATHKVVEDDSGETVKYYQYELVNNPKAKLYRIGFTKAYVEQVIKDAA